MEHSTIEQTGEEAGQAEDLVCIRRNEAGRRPAAQFPCTKFNRYRKSSRTTL